MKNLKSILAAVFAILATCQATVAGDINVALETVLEFDGKEGQADKMFIVKMQDILEKIKMAITSSRMSRLKNKKRLDQIDFADDFLNVIKDIDKNYMGIVSKTIGEEIKRRRLNEDDFRELLEIPIRRSKKGSIKKRKHDSTKTSSNNLDQEKIPRSANILQHSLNAFMAWVQNIVQPKKHESKNKQKRFEKVSAESLKSTKSRTKKRKHKNHEQNSVQKEKKGSNEVHTFVNAITNVITQIFASMEAESSQVKHKNLHSSVPDDKSSKYFGFKGLFTVSSENEFAELFESSLKTPHMVSTSAKPRKKKLTKVSKKNIKKHTTEFSSKTKSISLNKNKKQKHKKSTNKDNSKKATKSIAKNEKNVTSMKTNNYNEYKDNHDYGNAKNTLGNENIAMLFKTAGSPQEALKRIEKLKEILLQNINETAVPTKKPRTLLIEENFAKISVVKDNNLDFSDHSDISRTNSMKHQEEKLHDDQSQEEILFFRSQPETVSPRTMNKTIANSINQLEISDNINVSENSSIKTRPVTETVVI